jgi:hypothetical protein
MLALYSSWTHAIGWLSIGFFGVLCLPGGVKNIVALRRGDPMPDPLPRRPSRYGEAGERARQRRRPTSLLLSWLTFVVLGIALVLAPDQEFKGGPSGPASAAFVVAAATAGALIVLAVGLAVSITYFNRPRSLVPRAMRGDPGLGSEYDAVGE